MAASITLSQYYQAAGLGGQEGVDLSGSNINPRDFTAYDGTYCVLTIAAVIFTC